MLGKRRTCVVSFSKQQPLVCGCSRGNPKAVAFCLWQPSLEEWSISRYPRFRTSETILARKVPVFSPHGDHRVFGLKNNYSGACMCCCVIMLMCPPPLHSTHTYRAFSFLSVLKRAGEGVWAFGKGCKGTSTNVTFFPPCNPKRCFVVRQGQRAV